MNQTKKMVIIEPDRNSGQYFRDLWEYRELFVFLSLRDILVRYKQTAIGILWAVIRPLLSMAIFVIIFGWIARLPSEELPYPILVYSAMLPWSFFANSFMEASNSLIINTNLLTKVYFPRIIIPVSAVIISFVDACISAVILICIMLFYGYMPPLRFLLAPVFMLIAFMTSMGTSLIIASLNVKYRDFRIIIPFIVQFGMYISPVGFASSIVAQKWRILYSLNPMVGVIDGFRWCVSPYDIFYLPSFLIAVGMSIILLLCGIAYFRKFEKGFADYI